MTFWIILAIVVKSDKDLNPDFFKLIWFVSSNAKIGFSILSSQEIGSSLVSFEQIEVKLTGVEISKTPGIQPNHTSTVQEHPRTGTSTHGNILNMLSLQ